MPHKQIGVAQHAAEMLSDAGVQSVRSVVRLDRWKSTEIIKPYYRTDTSPLWPLSGAHLFIWNDKYFGQPLPQIVIDRGDPPAACIFSQLRYILNYVFQK